MNDSASPSPGAGLFSDLYELTMARAYLADGMRDEAVFELFVRELPSRRGFLLAAGMPEALRWLGGWGFDAEARAHLAEDPRFPADFLEALEGLRFEGTVHAVPEGTVVFADEPIVQVRAPLPQAQLVETVLLNLIHHQTLIASKAARVTLAARERPVVDFGARRAHGLDGALKLARCCHLAGFTGTSNVLAGRRWGLPTVGTMAHSYVEAFADEREAFRAFARHYEDTTLLLDTYDVDRAAERICSLRAEDSDFSVGAVRLDSGDIAAQARRVRARLDEAGLAAVRILASGGLDEDEIDALRRCGAPVDGFGVGTRVAASTDAPSLEAAYKLVAYAGRPRMKASTGKASWPGAKQVFRRWEGGRIAADTIARADEEGEGEALLRRVMEGGCILAEGQEDLETARAHAQAQIAALPEGARALAPAADAVPVHISEALEQRRRAVEGELGLR